MKIIEWQCKTLQVAVKKTQHNERKDSSWIFKLSDMKTITV